MSIGVNTPYGVLNALRVASADGARASERISSGLRVNRSSDDPAGLSLATSLAKDIGGYTAVKSGLASAITKVEQVSDSLSSIASILSSMQTLAYSAISASSASEFTAYQAAFDAYIDDIDTIASATTISGSSVLDGTASTITVQVSTDTSDAKTLTFFNSSSSGLSVSGLSISNATSAAATYAALDTPIDTTASRIAAVAAYEEGLGYLSDVADAMILNTSEGYDNIMSADLAQETANLAAAEIRQSASTAMVAQSNSLNKEMVDFLLQSVID
jgi:flagellin